MVNVRPHMRWMSCHIGYSAQNNCCYLVGYRRILYFTYCYALPASNRFRKKILVYPLCGSWMQTKNVGESKCCDMNFSKNTPPIDPNKTFLHFYNRWRCCTLVTGVVRESVALDGTVAVDMRRRVPADLQRLWAECCAAHVLWRRTGHCKHNNRHAPCTTEHLRVQTVEKRGALKYSTITHFLEQISELKCSKLKQ